MSGPRVMVVCDLDRTLIYSAAALGNEPPPLCCVEQIAGLDASFMTAGAVAALAELRERAEFVPTTTRTREQYARVRLPGPAPRYAIAANGGHLLDGGVSDAAWQRRVRERLRQGASLAEMSALLSDEANADWLVRWRVAEELFCYAIVDRLRLPDERLAELSDRAVHRGWTLSLQGRKLYLVPISLTKSAAAAELAGRLGADFVLAAGDSLLDVDLLEYADQAVRPAHGELQLADWSPPGLQVTAAAGVQGGEELVRWLVCAAGGHRAARD